MDKQEIEQKVFKARLDHNIRKVVRDSSPTIKVLNCALKLPGQANKTKKAQRKAQKKARRKNR